MKKQNTTIHNLKTATSTARDRMRQLALEEYKAHATVYATAKKLHITWQTAANWFKRFKNNHGNCFKERKRGPEAGYGGALDNIQKKKLARVLVDKTPDQLKFSFALWSSKAIKEYVKDTFKVDITRRTARRYMNILGFTYRTPERRAREQNPEKVKQWLEVEYPNIKAQARECKAKIMWGDETTNMAGACLMRGYAPCGKPAIMRAPDPRSIRCNSISAIGNRGDLFFRFFDDAMNTDIFKDFCSRLIREFSQPVFLIVDNLKVHHANILQDWFEQQKKEHGFRIFYLPSYSPELNPDEYFNRDIKAQLAEEKIARSVQELRDSIERHVNCLKLNPTAVIRLFGKEEVRYAAMGEE